MNRFVALVEKQPDTAELFAAYFIFEHEGGKWTLPGFVYLDRPFVDTGLKAYYDTGVTKLARFALAERYQNGKPSVKRLVKFAEAVGAHTKLEITQTTCGENPERSYLRSVAGERYTSPIDRDYVIEGLKFLLKTPSLETSRLIWQTMCSLSSDYLRATYQINQRGGPRYAASQLVHHLRQIAWVPQGDGVFLRPAEASQSLLPEDFPFHPRWRWIEAIHFGVDVAKKSEERRRRQSVAKDLGFDDDDALKDAQWFANLPLDQRQHFKSEVERRQYADLPEQEPSNPKRRAERVGAQAADAPERDTEKRTRSVSVGRELVKEEAAQYLLQQYTNSNDEMICQVCKKQLPFKLDDGTSYFEKVEFLPDLQKRHYQNYLALCPNHAAMFQYANGSNDMLQEMFVEMQSSELEVVLAQKDATIYFTKTHIADIKAVIKAEQAFGNSSTKGTHEHG